MNRVIGIVRRAREHHRRVDLVVLPEQAAAETQVPEMRHFDQDEHHRWHLDQMDFDLDRYS